MSVSCEYSVLTGKGSLRRADHLSRGVLLTVVCLTVSHNEASTMRRLCPTGGSCPMVKKTVYEYC